MDKVDKVLSKEWVKFNREVLTLNLKQLKEALKREKAGENRVSFIYRINQRIRKVAGQMATKG